MKKKLLNLEKSQNIFARCWMLILMVLMLGGTAFGQTTIFSENMYNGTGGTSGNSIATHETNNRFNEDGLTYSGSGDMRNSISSTISDYPSASGTWNVMLNSNPETFIIDGINASSYSALSLSFGVRKGSTAEDGSTLNVEYSTTGESGSYTSITFGALPTGSGTAAWYLRSSMSAIPSNVTTIRFRTSSAVEFRIDDVKLTGTLASGDPVLAITGTTDNGTSCPTVAAATQTYTITNTGTTAAAGVTVVSNDPQFVVSGLSSTTIAGSGGTVTYSVTFTPTTAGAKTATITVASTTTGSNSPTSALTGSGTAVALGVVTTSVVGTITGKSAILNGNVTSLGSCPVISQRGFVYSVTATNPTPTNAGGGVVTFTDAGTSSGTYSYTANTLLASTQYSYRAYVLNGATYTYGSVINFTTSPALVVSGTLAHGSICPGFAAPSQTNTITNNSASTVTGITVGSNNPEFVVSGLSATSIAAGAAATYTVTFTPATSGAKAATITISSSQPDLTSTLSGTGTAIALGAVTTSAVGTITAKSAVLNGNVSSIGTCPAISERGFVYSVTATNGTPTNAGTGVTTVAVAGITTGAITNTPTTLLSSTAYSYRAYVLNGATYTYGNVLTFTTSPALVVTGTLAHGSTCPTVAASSQTNTIKNNSASTVTGISVGSTNAEFAVSGLSGTSIASGATATYTVTFTPATSGVKAATITVTSSEPSVTSTLSGTGITPVTPSVTSGAATLVGTTTATLNASASTFGVCPPTTVKGFVYSETTTNGNPINGGTSVTNIVVASPGSAGSFIKALTALTPDTGYSFTPYLYDGTTYTYGAVTTFTTLTPPDNDECASATQIVVNTGYIVGTNVNATSSTGAPAVTTCGGYGTGGDVWFKIIVPTNGEITVTTASNGGITDSVIVLYTGTCGSLTQIACNDDYAGLGNMSQVTQTGLTAGTTVFVRVYEWGNNSFGTFNIRVTSPLPCAAPVAQASALTFGTVGSSTIAGSFTATTADKYLVVQSTSATLSADPVNTTTYAMGAALGGGTVVQSSNATTFTATGLTTLTTYYFFVFAYNDAGCSGGPVYNVTTSLSGNATTIDGPCYETTFPASVFPTGWTNNGTTIQNFSGNFFIQINAVNKSATLPSDNDLIEHIEFELKGTVNLSNSWTLKVQSSNDNTTWGDVDTYAGSTTSNLFVVKVSSAINKKYVRFITSALTANAVHIDNVKIFCFNGTPDILLSSTNPATVSSDISKGGAKAVIYKFDLKPTTAGAALKSVAFTTAGSYTAADVTDFKLWFSTDATFDGADAQVGTSITATLGAGLHTFSGFTKSIAKDATGYFFITAAVSCSATVAKTITVNAITTSDLTFISGVKTGTAYASGTQTIIASAINNATAFASSNCTSGGTTLAWTLPTGCFDEVVIFAKATGTFSATPSGDGSTFTANSGFGSGTAFDGGFVVYKGFASTVNVTGLTNGTNYNFKLFTRQGTVWSSGVTASCNPTATYCSSAGASGDATGITSVVFNTINQTSTSTSAYTNYTGVSTSVEKGLSYNLSVKVNTDTYRNYTKVWIDWNRNGSFADAGEVYDLGDAYTGLDELTSSSPLSIEVPLNASAGTTRMRVATIYFYDIAEISQLGPCETYDYGEVEDYTLNITAACTPSHTIASYYPTSGPAGTVITVVGSGFSASTTAKFGTTAAAVTLVNSEQIKVTVPVGSSTSNLIISDALPCKSLAGTFTVITKDIGDCEGGTYATAPGDLFMSQVTDAYSGGMSYIEIVNATVASVNLSNYSIKIASNGGAAFATVVALNNVNLASGGVYTVAIGGASSACSVPGADGSYANQISSAGAVNFKDNEHDFIGLFKDAALVDSWGVQGNSNWAFGLITDQKGANFKRKNTVTVPNISYSNSDWNIVDWTSCAQNDYSDIGTFSYVIGAPPVITIQPVANTFTCSTTSVSFSVTATEGVAAGVGLAYQWYMNQLGTSSWILAAGAGISGATSVMLNVSNPSLYDGYQFYCQVRENLETCFTATKAVGIIGSSGTITFTGGVWVGGQPDNLTKNVIIGAGETYNTSAGTIKARTLTNNGTINVVAETTVEIEFSLINNGEFNIANSGSLVQNCNVENEFGNNNVGQIKMERITPPMYRYDFTYWSSPVKAFVLKQVSPTTLFDKFFSWNAVAQVWLVHKSNEAPVEMEPGRGYTVRAPQSYNVQGAGSAASHTANFIGIPNNGIVTESIMGSTTVDKWNLLGNPYPSALDADKFIAANNSNLGGTLYFWTHKSSPTNGGSGSYYSYVSADYVSWNGSGSTTGCVGCVAPSGQIGAGQSFFVKGIGEGAGLATFNNTMRPTGNNTQFYKPSPTEIAADAEKHRVWLNLTGATKGFNQTLVGYIYGATNTFDNRFDGETFGGNEVTFYSVLDTKKLVIQGRALPFLVQDAVPLGYKTTLTGNLTISIDHADGLLLNQAIYLEDTVLNVTHNLTTSNYVFASVPGTFDSRFVLRYLPQEDLANPTFDDKIQGVTIRKNNADLHINSPYELIDIVRVYDITGRLVFEKKQCNSNRFDTSQIVGNDQTLIVKVQLVNGGVVTQKVY